MLGQINTQAFQPWDDPNMSVAHASVLGWGYQGRSVDDLVSFVKSIGGGTVVDVRLNAVSRRRGFSKKALGEALAGQGIEYVHVRALGNPRENRPGFSEPESDDGARAHAHYRLSVLEGSDGRRALDELEHRARRERVVLLCFEEDECRCHRSLVASALRRRLEVA